MSKESYSTSTFAPLLQSYPDEELFDLIVAGFGPAGLAIAVALHDSLEKQSKNGIKPKVLFLEKQSNFAWHSGMLLPDAKMQISFIKDMATLRNPLSKFTFMNYLKSFNRLVPFTQLNTFLPSREEFEDYLRWCSSHFSNVVRYGEPVESISPTKEFDHFQVKSRHFATNELISRRAKHVVVAIGGYPDIPQPFHSNSHQSYIHSSQYAHTIGKILPNKQAQYSIGIIGGGQSGAEIFNDLHARYPNAKTSLLIRGTALRPSDDSPFVNEVFDPDRISGIFDSPEDIRLAMRTKNKATNYGVVRLELLDELYKTLFLQRLNHGQDETKWQHRIIRDSKIHNVGFHNPSSINIDIECSDGYATKSKRESFKFDAIVFATGYKRNGYQKLLEPLTEIFGPTDQWAKIDKDYRLLVPNSTCKDSGLWLQGCNEATHGLSDSLLSGLAVRGGQIISSIFKFEQPKEQARL